jgi:hypothetical protein
MSRLTCSISVSLDGYVAGPDPGPEQGLGAGGEQLHDWIFGLASWREMHGKEGGERNVDSDLLQEGLDATGAIIIGKRMFGGWDGPWGDDPPKLERTRIVESPSGVAHLRYTVTNP